MVAASGLVRASLRDVDVFLTKVSGVTGMQDWTVHRGAPKIDAGYGVACDSLGNVYVVGWRRVPARSR